MLIHDCYQIMIKLQIMITFLTKYFPYELESTEIRSTIRLIKSQLFIRLSNLRSNKVIIVRIYAPFNALNLIVEHNFI